MKELREDAVILGELARVKIVKKRVNGFNTESALGGPKSINNTLLYSIEE